MYPGQSKSCYFLEQDHIIDRDLHVHQTSIHDQVGQACVHPELELWPPNLLKHFTKPEPLQCSTVEQNWVYVSNGKFMISAEAEKRHGQIECEYLPVIRITDFKNNFTEPIKVMKNGSILPSDFFKVNCVTENKNYSSTHSGISLNPSVRNRPDNTDQNSTVLGMNIVMFGFDSVSRLTWIRDLPKTYNYLTEELGSVTLEGYNIVGDGTPQALLPILTGQTEIELPEARRGFKGAKQVDGHPWLWQDLVKIGYVTQWGEDSPGMGTFTYRMLGFKDQPTDHYMRTFYNTLVKDLSHKQNCLGSLPNHVNMLNWMKELFHVYPDQPKFSFVFHSEYSHGSTNKLQVADEDVLSFLQHMNRGGHLNNTLLILMADHGARFQDLRGTVQGKYEERMPFMSLRFPPWFQSKFPDAIKNLRTNVNRLSTPFDVHATLRDINNFTGSGGMGNINDRGISLLKEIPKGRTCQHADMEAHWCACLNWTKVSVTDKQVQEAANQLVIRINNLTSQHRDECAYLRVDTIHVAETFTTSDSLLKFKQSKTADGRVPDLTDKMEKTEELFQITISTEPGGGRFEATVKYSIQHKTFTSNSREISRTNMYGMQPHCIADQHPHLRPYCYCIVQLTHKPTSNSATLTKSATTFTCSFFLVVLFIFNIAHICI